MKKRSIKCPHCGDIWYYNYIIDHETNKSIVTADFSCLEDGSLCTCWHCKQPYTLHITEKPDISMYNTVYNVWKRCKM